MQDFANSRCIRYWNTAKLKELEEVVLELFLKLSLLIGVILIT
jgi:hypothetical protein